VCVCVLAMLAYCSRRSCSMAIAVLCPMEFHGETCGKFLWRLYEIP